MEGVNNLLQLCSLYIIEDCRHELFVFIFVIFHSEVSTAPCRLANDDTDHEAENEAEANRCT